MKRARGSLMTNQAGSAVHGRGGRNKARVSTHQCVWSGKDRRNPQDRTDGEGGGKKPEHSAILLC